MHLPELQPETSLKRSRIHGFAFVILFVIIIILYSNTWNVPWHFDDIPNILERKSLHITIFAFSFCAVKLEELFGAWHELQSVE